ncbi:IclR family transcriptional regulator [Pseudonocardia sp. KRD291]|uniref:IclR family transcriptional regulator n=1 Tax=Pseudonocardia sp. KRD291 TaxID=2792007 RepID=UPI001C4A18B0|nr:IclR family transcriptional regulator [Pseudonocardia sp. KRD291]MBW0102713.1 IclR family transcriptional regulator [Pseudonocardia sp. KRD291]
MATARAGADSGRRALDVLFAFTEQRPVLAVRELAEILDIPAPTVHRYVALLRDMGLLEESSRGRYHLSMRVAALGRAARRAAPIVDTVEPLMRALSERTGESVLLMRLVHGAPVCIHRVESPSRFRLSFEPGQLLPALRGASVRLLLGALDPEGRRHYVDEALKSGALPPVNGRDGYLGEVERDVARGWAVSNEEIDEGVWAPAAAVYEDGRIVAAISAPCPVFRVDDARRDEIVEMVRKTAAAASDALGS